MTTQTSLPNDTQPATQSWYNGVITRQQSTRAYDGQDDSYAQDGQSQARQYDSGHVDLLSDFQPYESIVDGIDGGNDDAMELNAFSPSQPELYLSQFPESQRFKTPATAGKKRYIDGNIAESPLLPRNPLVRDGSAMKGRTMGLSQAFAGTQAASSPFSSSLPAQLQSDRPSPDVQVQVRPSALTSSSPLLHRTPIERLRTPLEPAASYKTVRQSQSERARRAASEGVDKTELSDDEFGIESSVVRRHQRQRKRELAARQQFQALSSPMRPRSSNDEHLQSSKRRRVSRSPPRRMSHSSDQAVADTDVLKTTERLDISAKQTTDSEDDTDLDLEEDVPPMPSSQTDLVDEEDKENLPANHALVPATVKTKTKLQNVLNDAPDAISSPMVARSNGHRIGPQDDEQPAVLNSQPSQPLSRDLFEGKQKLLSSGEIVIVPQSPPAVESGAKTVTTAAAAETTSTGNGNSIAPFSRETSNMLPSHQVSHQQYSDTTFETAPSQHPRLDYDLRPEGTYSSPSSVFSQPRRSGRHLMAEIAAQPSPQRSQDASMRDMLAHVEDADAELLGSQSPIRPGRLAKRRFELLPKETLPAISVKRLESHQEIVLKTQQEIVPKAPAVEAHPTTTLEQLAPVQVENDISTSPQILFPDQVWACFNGKTRAYYGTRCLGRTTDNPPRYRVQWAGFPPQEVDIHGIRSLDLRLGDVVKIDKKPHVVRGFKDIVQLHESVDTVTDIYGHRTLVVAQKQRQSLPMDSTEEQLIDVPISTVYLDSNLWQQMKDRSYEAQESTAQPREAGISTPIERPSTPSTPSSRTRRLANSTAIPALVTQDGIFSRMIFAISYDETMAKSHLTQVLQRNGATILNDGFHELFEDDSLVLKTDYAESGFCALLADRHSRKEKYMQALALMIPAISGNWVDACIAADQIVAWEPYLLPAGESVLLGGATRSRILPTSDAQHIKLSDVLQNRPQLLTIETTTRAVMVTGRHAAVEKKRASYLFLIRALGLRDLEKAADVSAAISLLKSDSALEKGWLFVEDKEVNATCNSLQSKDISATAPAASGKSGRKGRRSTGIIADPQAETSTWKDKIRVVGNEFVVQSLIAGMLVDDGKIMARAIVPSQPAHRFHQM